MDGIDFITQPWVALSVIFLPLIGVALLTYIFEKKNILRGEKK